MKHSNVFGLFIWTSCPGPRQHLTASSGITAGGQDNTGRRGGDGGGGGDTSTSGRRITMPTPQESDSCSYDDEQSAEQHAGTWEQAAASNGWIL